MTELTKEDILAMRPGREMDKATALALGWLHLERGHPDGYACDRGGEDWWREPGDSSDWRCARCDDSCVPPWFSRSNRLSLRIIDSWKWNWSILRDVGRCRSYDTVGDREYRVILGADGMPMEGVTGDTLAEAICKAHLLQRYLNPIDEEVADEPV